MAPHLSNICVDALLRLRVLYRRSPRTSRAMSRASHVRVYHGPPRLPVAHVLTAGDAHLRVLGNFRNMVRCCMLPVADFLTDLFLVEDGENTCITVSFLNSLDMLREGKAGQCETRLVKTHCGSPGVLPMLAFEAGRLTGLVDTCDRIIMFSDDTAMRSELEPLGVRFVSPHLFERHEQWWATRERELLAPSAAFAITPLVPECSLMDAPCGGVPPEIQGMDMFADLCLVKCEPRKPAPLEEAPPILHEAKAPVLPTPQPPPVFSTPQPPPVVEAPAAPPSPAAPPPPPPVVEAPTSPPSPAAPPPPPPVVEAPAAPSSPAAPPPPPPVVEAPTAPPSPAAPPPPPLVVEAPAPPPLVEEVTTEEEQEIDNGISAVAEEHLAPPPTKQPLLDNFEDDDEELEQRSAMLARKNHETNVRLRELERIIEEEKRANDARNKEHQEVLEFRARMREIVR